MRVGRCCLHALARAMPVRRIIAGQLGIVFCEDFSEVRVLLEIEWDCGGGCPAVGAVYFWSSFAYRRTQWRMCGQYWILARKVFVLRKV